MLLPSTEEMWSPAVFELPEMPSSGDPRQIGIFLADWVYQRVPFELDHPIYRARYAENAKGNCFAVTEAVAAIATHWGLPNFVILEIFEEKVHASNVILVGDEPIYIDAVHDPFDEDLSKTIKAVESTWASIYDLRVAPVVELEHRKFFRKNRHSVAASYYWNSSTGVQEHEVHGSLNEFSVPIVEMGEFDERNLHVLISGAEGIEMLHAIGDLQRYLELEDYERYEQRYPELIDIIPSFVSELDLPEPSLSVG